MYGRKGYIRTLEAIIAIVILLFFVFSVSSRKIENVKETPIAVKVAQNTITNELLTNADLRNEILKAVNTKNPKSNLLEHAINKTLPPNFAYEYAICKYTTCIKPIRVDTSIYSTDVFIFSSKEDIKPALVRVWIWKKTA